MEGTLEKIVELIKSRPPAGNVSVKEEGNGSLVVEGVHVMRLPSRDAYSFGLQLLDIFFTKATSLLFKSKKSDKPELNQEKVQQLLSCIEKRYGRNWDIKTFTTKANQKCRDSK